MKALIMVDIQNDFLPGGALGIAQADQIIPLVNEWMGCFEHVIATLDWHPHNHKSFGNPWPIHCVQNTWGAQIPETLNQKKIEKIFHKGIDPEADSYSVFFDDKRRVATTLHAYLQKKNIHELYFAGLATDYCVLYSVLDALQLGYRVHVIAKACRAVGDPEKAFTEMKKHGANTL